jgi:outer membrane protein OmpA-like peptidoglycan-associated protein
MDRRDNRSAKRESARSLKLAPAFAMLAVLAAPSLASAQDASFYVDRLKISGAPEDGIATWRPQMGQKSRLFGQLGIGFGLRPFRVENYVDAIDQAPIVEEVNGPPVASQLVTYFTAGAEIADRFAIQVSFPLAFQSVNSTYTEEAQITDDAIDKRSVVPMDLRLDARLILFRNASRSFKLGLEGAVFMPTGNEFSWGGDRNVSGQLGIGAEYDAKSFFVVLNTGYHIRPRATLNEFTLDDELTYSLGGFVPLKEDRYRVGLQVFGSAGLLEGTRDVDNVPLEWMAEGRMNLGDDPRQFYVGLGAGTRLTAGYAPDFRAVGVVGGWFPLEDWDVKNDKGFTYKIPADSDGDKLADDIDMCPMDKEDRKGANTDDGCPELLNDADSDGVPDVEDACPQEPGPRDPDPAKNGCPKFIRRMKGSAQIEVLQEVQFAFDRADLLPPAFPILNEVVRLLKVNPDIVLVSIEGHTDDLGSHEHNDELSGARARSVMAYLIRRGIVPNRLEAKGYGKRKPIADNQTAEGRQKNRRVEFHIRTATPTPAAPPAGTPTTPAGTTAPGTTPATPGATPGAPAGTTPAPSGTPGATPAPTGTTPAPAGSPAPGTTGKPGTPAGATPAPAGSPAPATTGKSGAPTPAPTGAAPATTGKAGAPAPAPTGAAPATTGKPAAPAPSPAPAGKAPAPTPTGTAAPAAPKTGSAAPAPTAAQPAKRLID